MKNILIIIGIITTLVITIFLIVRNIVKNLDYSFEGFTTLIQNFELNFKIINKSAFSFTFKKVDMSVIDNNNRTVISFKPIENISIKKGSETNLILASSTMDLGAMLTDIAQNKYDNYRLLISTKILGFMPIRVKCKIKEMLL